ncbi:MAG: TetR/AcrR family transcriptional regulator [Candidatus Obscuribacterales bacterium]|jgi:AcrR family transcriptional regulator
MARTKAIPNRAELIVGAAEELFARYGYERTSIDDIARHLGIGKGSIYLDFRTKDDILFTVISKYAECMKKLMQNKLDNVGSSPLAALKEILEQTVTMVYDNVTRDIHTPEALLHTSLTMKSRFAHFFVFKRTAILQLLQMAARAGEIEQDKASEEMAMTILMATSTLYPPYFNNYNESETTIKKQQLLKQATLTLDLIIDGLKAS